MSARKVFVTDFAQNRVHERKMLFSHDILHKDCKRKSPKLKISYLLQFNMTEWNLFRFPFQLGIHNLLNKKNLYFNVKGKKTKRRITKRVLQENKARRIFRKTNITYPLTYTRACRMYVKPNISNRLKLLKNFLKLSLFGQVSIVSRVQGHYEETVFF